MACNEYLQDVLIAPRRGRREKTLPPLAIMVTNPPDAEVAGNLLRQRQSQTRFLHNTNLLVPSDEVLCVAGPALGAPAAGLVMEKLIVLGVRTCWLLSCCGAIDPSWSIGDVVVPSSGVPGEGVSSYYGGRRLVKTSRTAVNDLRSLLNDHNVQWRNGVIWSTDAPYRERRSALFALQQRYGVGGVDMEFTALCSIAACRGIDFGAVFVVSDELWGPRWVPGFSTDWYRESSRSVLEHMLNFKQPDISGRI